MFCKNLFIRKTRRNLSYICFFSCYGSSCWKQVAATRITFFVTKAALKIHLIIKLWFNTIYRDIILKIPSITKKCLTIITLLGIIAITKLFKNLCSCYVFPFWAFKRRCQEVPNQTWTRSYKDFSDSNSTLRWDLNNHIRHVSNCGISDWSKFLA